MKNILDCRDQAIEYTGDQKKALEKIQDFFDRGESSFFILSGKSGTGKTTIIENIAKYSNAVIMAPTNAAVRRLFDKISNYEEMSTIHKIIYGEPDKYTGEWIPKTIEFDRTYIIDESSMIDDKILQDIIDLANVYRNTIVFVGDDFQLPPVGKDPGLFKWDESEYGRYFKSENKYHLSEVKRYVGDILLFSNYIRDNSKIPVKNKSDIRFVDKFGKALYNDVVNDDNYVVIVSTNRERMFYNSQIRKIKYPGKDDIAVNPYEKVVSVANNLKVNSEVYTIIEPEIKDVFKDVVVNTGSVRFPKYKTYDMYYVYDKSTGEKSIVIPDLDIPSLYGQMLAEHFKDDQRFVISDGNKRRWNKLINICTYGNCLTCHKAQGNEYDNVFVDCSWLPDTVNPWRWFYTAFTRTKKKLYIKHSKYFDYN